MSDDVRATAPDIPYTPRINATDEELSRWKHRRAEIGERVRNLAERGICYSCQELAEGNVLGPQDRILDDDDVQVVLSLDPRVAGHTIVVWKRHAHDFTELDDSETARLFTVCRNVARALRAALTDVERVYQVTMCDGPINHLHVQLIPRYAGTPIGSRRLVDPRGPVLDGDQLAATIGSAYRTANVTR